MRKDVKIGLGIGGVLLAVLIVYLLVPKTNDGTDQARSGESTHATGAEGEDGGVLSTGGTRGTNQDRATGNGSSAETPHEVAQAPDRQTAQQPTTPDGGAERDGPAPQKVNWDDVFATGIIPEEAKLGMVNPGGTPEDPFADKNPANGKTGGNEPDWTGTRGGPAAPGKVGTPQAPTPPVTPGQSPAASARPKGSMTEHVIQQDENLSMIAAVAYGDARHYKEILKANPNLDERKLKPGTVLKMPHPSTFTAAKAQQAAAKQEAAVDEKTQYRVQQGDSLHKIAVKLYGKAAKADALYDLNKDRIGDDSARLKLGMVLKLPEAPSVAQTSR